MTKRNAIRFGLQIVELWGVNLRLSICSTVEDELKGHEGLRLGIKLAVVRVLEMAWQGLALGYLVLTRELAARASAV